MKENNMTKIEVLLAELKQEAEITKNILQRVPLEKADWAPHEKSMKLGRLASHVAEVPGWIAYTLSADELDFAKMDYKPFVPDSTEALLEHLDKNVKIALTALENANDEELLKPWTMRSGEQIFFTKCKQEVVRTMCYSHLVHHRAQLGVYLRMLDVALPGSYGPTADEK